MDLNQLYFVHQVHLMRAGEAPSAERRDCHRECASHVARRIAHVQTALGALAAGYWTEAAGE